MILKTQSGPLYFEITGDGPPIVFASGWAMSCECWRPAVAELSRKYRCLIYDSRGIGRSQLATIDARFEIEDHAEDLHTILQAAGIFDAILVGHEIGSLVAAVCADRHPQDARSMVIVSPRTNLFSDEIRNLAVFTPAALALRELAAYPLIRSLVAWRFRRAPTPHRKRLYDDFANLNPRAAYETALSVANLDRSAQSKILIRQAKSPVLIVCGEKDKKGLAQARELFSKVRAGKLVTVSNCGFLPMLEYPKRFVKLLDDFIASSR